MFKCKKKLYILTFILTNLICVHADHLTVLVSSSEKLANRQLVTISDNVYEYIFNTNHYIVVTCICDVPNIQLGSVKYTYQTTIRLRGNPWDIPRGSLTTFNNQPSFTILLDPQSIKSGEIKCYIPNTGLSAVVRLIARDVINRDIIPTPLITNGSIDKINQNTTPVVPKSPNITNKTTTVLPEGSNYDNVDPNPTEDPVTLPTATKLPTTVILMPTATTPPTTVMPTLSTSIIDDRIEKITSEYSNETSPIANYVDSDKSENSGNTLIISMIILLISCLIAAAIAGLVFYYRRKSVVKHSEITVADSVYFEENTTQESLPSEYDYAYVKCNTDPEVIIPSSPACRPLPQRPLMTENTNDCSESEYYTEVDEYFINKEKEAKKRKMAQQNKRNSP